jgi:hypothetical protein
MVWQWPYCAVHTISRVNEKVSISFLWPCLCFGSAPRDAQLRTGQEKTNTDSCLSGSYRCSNQRSSLASPELKDDYIILRKERVFYRLRGQFPKFNICLKWKVVHLVRFQRQCRRWFERVKPFHPLLSYLLSSFRLLPSSPSLPVSHSCAQLMP